MTRTPIMGEDRGSKGSWHSQIPSGLFLTPEVPTRRKERDEPIHQTYCPLAEGLCSDVQCEKCSLIEEAYPEGVWVCTVCADLVQLRPFYGDGECFFCGHESGFLALGEE